MESSLTENLAQFICIYLIVGNKGGVGKSTYARILIELLQMAGFEVTIVEADRGIPDVGLTFGVTTAFNLHTPNGFLDLVNRLGEADAASPVVISTPGGLLERAAEDGKSFFDALGSLEDMIGRRVCLTWVIDNKRDSVESLSGFLRTAPGKLRIDVVKNLHFADVAGFELFDRSKTRAAVIARGGRILEMPALAERIAATMTNKRLTIAKAKAELPLGERIELLRWVEVCRAMLKDAAYLP